MALDFPNNPTVNQQFAAPNGVTYVWDGVKWSVLVGSGGGGGGVIGNAIVDSLSISPGQIAGVAPTSRLGLNLQIGSDNQWHYLGNGPAGIMIMQSTSSAGPASRLSLGVEDINAAGPGAVVPNPVSGALNLVYGPQGGGPGHQFVVVGDATHIPNPMPSVDTLVASQLIIQPGAFATGATSRLGMNSYYDQNGITRYSDNGPAALISLLSSSGGLGADSRLSIAIADINNAGTGTAATMEGIVNIVYGQAGTAADHAFVVIGNAANIPSVQAPFGTLFANQIAIEPGQYGASPTHSDLGLNMYVDNTGIQQHIGDGPGALFSMNPTNPHGAPQSRMTLAISDIASGGTTPAVGILNLVYGPQGGGTGNAYVVIGDGSRLPSFQPPQDSLLCDELYLKFQQVQIGPTGSGPGGTGRALYLA